MPESATTTPTAAATPTATPANNDTTNNNTNTTANNNNKKKAPIEYNPRWKGYTFILLSSLINFMAVGTVEQEKANNAHGIWGVSIHFGIIQFIISFFVLFTDRLQIGLDTFNYSKCNDGKFEGYCLVFLTIYSIVGVAYQTQVRGIAYLSLNMYFSAWLTTAACIYTLNKWSFAKDILTIQELTSISATLKSWYIVFLSSMVVTGTSINMLIVIDTRNDPDSIFYNEDNNNNIKNENTFDLHADYERASVFGIVFGFASTIISFAFILTHYNIIEFCVEGGWFEFMAIIVTFLMWLVGTAVLTADGGLAATIIGSGCQDKEYQDTFFNTELLKLIQQEFLENGKNETECYIQLQNVTYQCIDYIDWDYYNDKRNNYEYWYENYKIPGSNLYLSTWTCLLASLNLASRWKAQQALQFAQAQQEKAFKKAMKQQQQQEENDNNIGISEVNSNNNNNVSSDSLYQDDDNDHVLDFEDADEF